MIPAAVVFLYLGTVLAIGLFANRVSARRPDACVRHARWMRSAAWPS